MSRCFTARHEHQLSPTRPPRSLHYPTCKWNAKNLILSEKTIRQNASLLITNFQVVTEYIIIIIIIIEWVYFPFHCHYVSNYVPHGHYSYMLHRCKTRVKCVSYKPTNALLYVFLALQPFQLYFPPPRSGLQPPHSGFLDQT